MFGIKTMEMVIPTVFSLVRQRWCSQPRLLGWGVCTLALTLALTHVASPVLAGIVVVSSERRLTVDSTKTDTISASFTELDGAFQKTVMFEDTVREDGVLLGTVSGSAMIDSRVTSQEILARGHGTGFASGNPEILSAVGISQIMMIFDLDEPSSYTFEGRVTLTPRGNDFLSSVGRIRLLGPTGVIHQAEIGAGLLAPESGEVRFMSDQGLSGTLPAGRYTIEAYAEGHGEANKTRCVDFELRFSLGNAPVVPEPTSASSLILGSVLLWGGLRRRKQTSAVAG